MDVNSEDNYTLSSVFSESYFEIPDYQRDYAWRGSNVDDLLEDIEFVYDRNVENSSEKKVNHYFGTLVFERKDITEPTDYEDFVDLAIVDGQQRLTTVVIIISCIVEEIEEMVSVQDIDEGMKEDMNKKINDISENYIEYEGIARLALGGLAQDAYQGVILGDQSPEDFLDENDTVEAERRVAEAKMRVQSKLDEWRAEKSNSVGESNKALYYKFLKKVVGILTQRFEVNVKIVEDVDEAARMFKVINNRGRGLSLHDKVRSHLVYCASQSEELESEKIYRQFNEIVKKALSR